MESETSIISLQPTILSKPKTFELDELNYGTKVWSLKFNGKVDSLKFLFRIYGVYEGDRYLIDCEQTEVEYDIDGYSSLIELVLMKDHNDTIILRKFMK